MKEPRPVKSAADLAASYISGGRPTTRCFDSCFEWWGADAVALTLYRRTQKRPNTKLAQNLYNYLSKDAVMETVKRYGHWQDLEALADKMAVGDVHI